MAAMPSIHGRDGEEVSLHLGKESKRKMHQGTERKTERDTEREANLRTARATTKCLWGFLVHNKVAHPPFCTIVQRPSRPPDDISAAIGIRGTRALRRPPPIVSHPMAIMLTPSQKGQSVMMYRARLKSGPQVW